MPQAHLPIPSETRCKAKRGTANVAVVLYANNTLGGGEVNEVLLEFSVFGAS